MCHGSEQAEGPMKGQVDREMFQLEILHIPATGGCGPVHKYVRGPLGGEEICSGVL